MIKSMAVVAVVAALAGPAIASEAEFGAAAAAAGSEIGRQIAAKDAQFGRAGEAGRVIRDQTTNVSIDLNAKTVKCSQADYAMPMLKVLVPGLAELTVLNHRNTKEGAPCVGAGRCGGDLGPERILGAGAGTVQVPVRVTLRKVTEVVDGVCSVSLVETVQATIRGVPFFHERIQAVAERVPEDCR